MKMDSFNISVPQPLADFARREIEADYGNASEYFRELLRERKEKRAAEDVALLESTHKNAPAGPTEEDVEQILKIQRRVRRGLNARRS